MFDAATALNLADYEDEEDEDEHDEEAAEDDIDLRFDYDCVELDTATAFYAAGPSSSSSASAAGAARSSGSGRPSGLSSSSDRASSSDTAAHASIPFIILDDTDDPDVVFCTKLVRRSHGGCLRLYVEVEIPHVGGNSPLYVSS